MSHVAAMTDTPLRRLPLRGAVNVRDMGGYVGAEGRRLRWGQLYRGDQLADLDAADIAQLQEIGLRSLCDLRAESERVQKPNRVPGTQITVHNIGFMPHRGDVLLAETRDGKLSVDDIETRVVEIYRRFVIDQTAVFGRLLRLLADAPLPLLYHCTSGRDRTGWASATLLLALGATRETVALDYALSNDYRRDLTFQVGGAVDASIMAALTQAHPRYLSAAFACVDETWGSDAAYLRDGLGCSTAQQQHLQARFLEAGCVAESDNPMESTI